jgi:hypothetical protein
MENPHIDWLAARSGSVAALGGAEVYRALGAEDNITYWSDVQDGSHCASRPEWSGPLQQNIQKFLLNAGGNTGQIRISPSKAGNLSDWRNWTTPILADGPSTPPTTPPTTPPPPTPSTSPLPGGACTAGYELVNQWPSGFQAGVTVQAGAAPLDSWTVGWTFPDGQQITQLWNGVVNDDGPNASVSNASYNGSVPAGGSTSFGLLGSSGGTSTAPTGLTCTSP